MRDFDVIYEVYGTKSFLKIKKDSFGIGKVHFVFVNMDENKKELECIDCFLSMGLAGAFAMDILLGGIEKKAEDERKKAEKYPNAVWNSPLGGVSEDKAAARNMRKDGKAVSRCFSFGPGSTTKYIFTAVQRPGHTDKRGLIVPETGGRAEATVRVPVMDDETLRAMAYCLNNAILSYHVLETAVWKQKEVEERVEANRERTFEASKKSGNNIQKDSGYEKSQTQNMCPKGNVAHFYCAKSMSGVVNYKNGYAIKAVLDDNREIIVKFSEDAVKKMSEQRWETFKKRTSAENLQFRFNGSSIPRKDGKLLLEYISGF